MNLKESLDLLEVTLRGAWCKDTSSDPDNWTPQSPAWGQCAVTALIVNDILRGEFIRLDLKPHHDPKVAAVGSHYMNLTPVGLFDLTKSQFTDPDEYDRLMELSQYLQIRTRDYLLSNSDTLRRYELLKQRMGLK
jgi:hypothetical protein